MSDAKKYTGGCHCGAVRYEVMTDLSTVISCNCSLCARVGWLLAFVPAERFALLSGEEALTDYQFNKKVIHHLFCKYCGVRSFSRGTGGDGNVSVAVNVRCLDGVDAAIIPSTMFDGKSK